MPCDGFGHRAGSQGVWLLALGLVSGGDCGVWVGRCLGISITFIQSFPVCFTSSEKGAVMHRELCSSLCGSLDGRVF